MPFFNPLSPGLWSRFPSPLPPPYLSVSTSWTRLALSLTVDIQADGCAPRTPVVITGSAADGPGVPCNVLNPQHSTRDLIPRTLRPPLVGGDCRIAGVVATGQGHTVSFPNWCGVLNHCGYLLGGILEESREVRKHDHLVPLCSTRDQSPRLGGPRQELSPISSPTLFFSLAFYFWVGILVYLHRPALDF